MRYGFTTGSCAAAAAKAAAFMLLTGKEKKEIQIETPKGIPYTAELLDIERTEHRVSCAVRKDSGDDPDVTGGACVYAAVTWAKEEAEENVLILGGEGVGIVTKPGLDQPVGAYAINSTPRQMITKEVQEVMALCDCKGVLCVTISVPGGAELAQKTFNPRLGIEGGISILGTSGIVEPMSTDAILKTIETELRQKKALGVRHVPVSPGNYGLEFMKRTYDFDLDRSVKCSNFIGQMLDMASELGFESVLLTGHIGKMVKLAGGMMNTHSVYGDCRMELICAAAALEGAETALLQEVLNCVVTEDAVDKLDEAGIREKTMQRLMDKILVNLEKKAGEKIKVECMMYSNRHGLLAESRGANALLEIIKQNERD